MARDKVFLAGQFPLFLHLLRWSFWILLQAERSEGDRAVAFRLVSLVVAYHSLEAFLNEWADICLRSGEGLNDEERLCLIEKGRYLGVKEKLEKWPSIIRKASGKTPPVGFNILDDPEIHNTFKELRDIRHKLVHVHQEGVEQVLPSELWPNAAIVGKECPFELLPVPFPSYLGRITPEQAIRFVMCIVEKFYEGIQRKMPNFLKGSFQNIRNDLERAIEGRPGNSQVHDNGRQGRLLVGYSRVSCSRSLTHKLNA